MRALQAPQGGAWPGLPGRPDRLHRRVGGLCADPDPSALHRGTGAGRGGGGLGDAYSWQSIFWINLPIGVPTLGTPAASLPPGPVRPEPGTASTGRKADWTGQLLFVTGIGAMAYALIEAGQRGWGSPLAVGLLAGSVPVLGAFLRWESRTAHPLLPPALLRHRVVLMTCTVILGFLGFLGFFGLFGAILLLTLFLQQVNGLTLVQTGLRLPALTAAIAVAIAAVPEEYTSMTRPVEPTVESAQAAEFRSLMSGFPTGVVVVTTFDLEGAPHGMTCSSPCSVSLAPPTLLVCMRQGSATLRAVELFASGSPDRFDQVF